VVVRRADRVRPVRPERFDRQAVREVQVVGGGQRAEQERLPRRVLADRVTRKRDDDGFVDRDPEFHPIGEPIGDERRVLGEPLRDVTAQPAALVFEDLRRVPVVEGRDRVDPGLHETVDQPVVEVEARAVRRALSGRLHAWPGDGEPVRAHPEVLHQGDVVGVPVVVVARDLRRVVVDNGRELVPH
jgi:hypothetical protein